MDMKKIITKETRAKMNKALEESRPKKVLEIQGYSVWVDEMNYMVKNNRKTSYFSTLEKALMEIRDQLVRNKLKGSQSLDEAINRVNTSDKDFLNELIQRLTRLECTKQCRVDSSTVSI